jgi:CelD/BcsL family acetyltransferase involved in cellulose biosynthesis
MPNEQGWGGLVGGRLISTHHDPVLRFDGMSWEDFLASRSKNFREQVRRRERKIVREIGLSFRLADDPDRLEADLDSLFRLHAVRWGQDTTGVFEGIGPDFHRAFAADALRRGWLRLWLADVEGETVAAWYGWRFGGSEWYYQAGRDQRFDKLSLGFVLLTHTLREACRDGVDAYHFLLGDEEYKGRFTKEDPGSQSRLVGQGMLARASGLAIGLAASLPNSLRRRVMRISG